MAPTAHDGHSRPRLLLVEGLELTSPLGPFLSLRALSAYSGLSVRKLRDCLSDPVHPLPRYRVGGKILVRRSEFDTWMAQFKTVGNPNVEHVVAEVLADLGGLQRRN